MNHDDPAPRAAHPFFHTMVVMGSALAFGCGGLSGSDKSDGEPGGGTGGTTGGTGGTTAGTGGSSFGGTATAGTGGSGGSGGSEIIIATGGTGNVPVTPGPFPCAPETWTCNSYPSCAGRDYVLPNDCKCDGTRPASAEDCAADQSFVCRQAGSNASYQSFTEPVAFNCSCLPSGQSCEALCDQAFGDQGGAPGSCLSTTTDKGTDSVLCGCAQIVLR